MRNNTRNDILKVIAMVTMLIDHLGVLYFPSLLIFRTIGRIAFPIFAYQLALGYKKTSNRRKYRNRLLIFGLISQIPYMLLTVNLEPRYFVFNVILLFWFATLALELIDQIKKSFSLTKEKIYGTFLLIIVIIMIFLPDMVQVIFREFGLSYGTYGMIMILVFYLVGQDPIKIIIGYLAVSLIGVVMSGVYYYHYYNNVSYVESWLHLGYIWDFIVHYNNGLSQLNSYFFQARSMMAIPIIIGFEYLKPKFKLDRRVGYFFYPVHITLLVLFRLILQISF